MPPVVSVVVLAYGEEAQLRACVLAVLASVGPPLELIVVDNGAAKAVASLPEDGRLRVITPGFNSGYAEGCHIGARSTTGDVLAFVNSDAIVEPAAIGALATALRMPGVALVCGCVTLAEDPTKANSVGNPVHFSGLSWAGGHLEPAHQHGRSAEVTSVTGALFGVHRETWESLGGFDPEYFAYHEDVDLSLRAWLGGGRVLYVPEARAVHHYAFHRNPRKLYLLERNRLMTVLTTYPSPLLLRLAPALLLFELVMCCTALVQGWLPAKLRTYAWLARHITHIRRRRDDVQRQAVLSAREFAALLQPTLYPTNVSAPPGLPILNAVLATAFRLAIRTLPPSREHSADRAA